MCWLTPLTVVKILFQLERIAANLSVVPSHITPSKYSYFQGVTFTELINSFVRFV